MFDLAVVYETADGVRKNLRKAFVYFVSAAGYGDKQAYFEVGRMLFYGIGTTKDKILGNLWLDKAKKYGIDDK